MEITALVAELRKCALEGLQDTEKEKINREPHGVTFIVAFLTAATFLYVALRVNNLEHTFFWLWEEDVLLRSARAQTNTTQRQTKRVKQDGSLLPVVFQLLLLLETTGPIYMQHGANEKTKYSLSSSIF